MNSNFGRFCNKMIILIALFLFIGAAHLIISVTPSNSIVSANDQLAIKILTTSPISANTLSISLTTDFSLASPCLVNATATTCSFTTTTTAVTATLASTMLASNYYVVTLNVTNPIYASNFPLSASVSVTAFSNTGLITINAKSITCSLTPSTQLVGDTPIGYFQMNNDPLPPNSIISINSTLQTTFPNLFNAAPTCLVANSTYGCSLSTSFGQQFLTINSPPQSANLNIAVSTINNPPYNGSFASIGIQIQNTAGYFMQICSFTQQAVTTLRNSASFTITNWNNQIGATSTVAFTLSTYFKPYTTSLLWVFPNSLSITALTPASGTLSTQNGMLVDLISGASAVGNSLTFSAQITNPTSVQSLTSQIYVVYSASQFIQRQSITTMTLTALTFSPTISLSQVRTQYSSVYNISILIPYIISGGFSGSISILFGTITCNSLNLNSNAALQATSCLSNNFTFTSNSTLSLGLFWIAFNAQNYYSTRSNSISISLASPPPYYYSIGSGSASFNLAINNHPFLITNNNPVFAAQTTLTVAQSSSSITINPTINRIITLYLPKDLVFSTSTAVTAIQSSITSYTINTTAATITINAVGILNIQISNIGNPIKYNGSLSWSIIATDLLSNPSSSSTSQQQPMYTSTTAFLNYSFSNPTIQANNPFILTIIPALQYYAPPIITITFSDSLVLSCINCTIISSTSMSVTYTTAIMKISITIKNSNNPNGNSISTVISDGIIVYETGTISYALSPMTYGYIAYQTGMFQTVGSINITITSKPSQPLTLTYSDVSSILSSPTCITCSNTFIYITGIVQYFQTYTVTLTGMYNNTVYATAVVSINYVCQSIQGCNVCANQIVNQNTVLICQQCFTSAQSPYNLLYNNQCLQTCPISTYSNGITCVNCANLCYKCTILACEQCITGYYIYNNTCVSSCPSPMINNATHCISVPIQCPNNCASCPTNNVCTACNGGYYLLSNVCYSSCPAGYKPSGTTCILFIPPQETSYFPFPFIISSALIFIALIAMKCFEKRSLVMGNLIAFVSIVEVGSMIMTLTYTLRSSQDLVTQALCFILLFSKILLNLIFLCYFQKMISTQEQFQTWKQADQAHQKIYRTLITLCSILSFQIIRIIYSRLLGLRLFFGKFNTSLIFKPLNYFTITYFLTAGAALVVLSVRSILLQEGYHTSAFYSSIQSIIIQALLLIICIVDNKKGYDDEFFEYQVYKVNNQYEHSHIDPIDIEHQDENNAGSMHEMLNATSSAPKTRKKGSQIVRNPRWIRKVAKPLSYPDEEVKEEEIIQTPIQKQEQQQNNGEKIQSVQVNSADFVASSNQQQLKDNFGIVQNKKQNIFRRKIIEDWRKIQRSLPNKMQQLRFTHSRQKGSKKKHSVSPESKRKSVKIQLKRVSSMEKIDDVKLPESPATIPEKIREYFRQHSPVKIKQNTSKNLTKKSKKQIIEAEQPKSMTLEHQQSSQGNQQSLEGLLKDSSKVNHIAQRDKELSLDALDQLGNQIIPNQRRRRPRMNQHIVEEMPSQTNVEQSAYEEEEEKQANIEDQFSNDRVLYQEINSDKGQEMGQIQQNDLQFESNSQKKINLGNYRYKGVDEKQKHYRTKKRRVNRQTEEVYLQRLVASSDKKSRNLKHRKLQF